METMGVYFSNRYRKWAALCHPDRKNHLCDSKHFSDDTFDERPCKMIKDDCYWHYLHEAFQILCTCTIINIVYRLNYYMHNFFARQSPIQRSVRHAR